MKKQLLSLAVILFLTATIMQGLNGNDPGGVVAQSILTAPIIAEETFTNGQDINRDNDQNITYPEWVTGSFRATGDTNAVAHTVAANDKIADTPSVPATVTGVSVELTLIFTNTEVTATRNTSVVIQWDTNKVATGQVEYGLDTNYGNLTEVRDLSYWHMLEITGLAAGTTYHYRIRARDCDGNETISDDYNLKTLTTTELEAKIMAARIDGDLPKVYYMKPGGDNTKDGLSLDNAWETLSHAQLKLQPGDTLLIADGSYYNDTFVAQTSGIPEAPITIKSLSGTPTFIETGTVRTLYLFMFHDWGYPGPISYYNIEGLRIENYDTAFQPWRESHHLNFTNIETKDCAFSVHLLRGCYNVVMKDFTVENAYYAPFHFWYYNHHNILEDASVTGTIYDHGLIDFHTDNDYFAIWNVRFHGYMNAGEAIYFHGDYGTNDNNVLKNIEIEMDMEEDHSCRECLDIWTIGQNNHFEDLVLSHKNGLSNIIAIGTSGEGLPEGNFVMKNVLIKNPGCHGLYLEPANNVGKILFENITIEDTHTEYCHDIVVHYPQRFQEIIFRDIKGDNNDFDIDSYEGLPIKEIIEFTDGRVFSENYINTEPRYYPDKSYIEVEEENTRLITYYPMTAVPESDSAAITMNKFDTSLPFGAVLVDFTAGSTAGVSVTFTISDVARYEDYAVHRDGSLFATPTASSAGSFQFSNSDWATTHTFTITQLTTKPTITFHSPTGTLVPLTPTLSIGFSKPMSHTITEGAISISSGRSPTGFAWSDGDRSVNFAPSTPLTYVTTYTVTVSTAATDQEGEHLPMPYSWQFTTRPEVLWQVYLPLVLKE